MKNKSKESGKNHKKEPVLKKVTAASMPADWQHRLSQAETARALGISVGRMTQLTREGMPQNPDKSYDLPVVINWRIDRERRNTAGDPAKERKNEVMTEIKELELLKMRDEIVPRAEHEEILLARANALKSFFPQYIRRNAHHFLNKDDINDVQTMLDELWRQGLNAWVNGK